MLADGVGEGRKYRALYRQLSKLTRVPSLCKKVRTACERRASGFSAVKLWQTGVNGGFRAAEGCDCGSTSGARTVKTGSVGIGSSTHKMCRKN